MRRGHLNYAREQLSRAFTLFADVNQDRRRECAILLAFCNYFQVCRVKHRLEEDVVAFLGQEECAELKALADALRRADAQRFAQLLQNVHLRFGDFMHDLLATVSASTLIRRDFNHAIVARFRYCQDVGLRAEPYSAHFYNIMRGFRRTIT